MIVEEAVPDIFDEDVYSQSGSQWQGLADLLDGTIPGLLFAYLGVDYRRDKEHGCSSD